MGRRACVRRGRRGTMTTRSVAGHDPVDARPSDFPLPVSSSFPSSSTRHRLRSLVIRQSTADRPFQSILRRPTHPLVTTDPIARPVYILLILAAPSYKPFSPRNVIFGRSVGRPAGRLSRHAVCHLGLGCIIFIVLSLSLSLCLMGLFLSFDHSFIHSFHHHNNRRTSSLFSSVYLIHKNKNLPPR